MRICAAASFISAIAANSLAIGQTGPSARLSGLVVADSAQAGAGFEVVILSLARRTTTNEHGEFALEGIPAGSHDVLVRRVGYDSVSETIKFAAGEHVTRRYSVTSIARLGPV